MAPPLGKRKSSPAQAPVHDTPALPSEVEALQLQLRLSRLQCADLHRQLQSAALRDPAELEQRLAMAREALRSARDSAKAQRAQHREELEDLRLQHHSEVQRLTEARDRAERDARLWQAIADVRRNHDLGPQDRDTPDLESVLKQLTLICHPDRWSAGQPATALAHELSVTINDLRQKGKTP